MDVRASGCEPLLPIEPHCIATVSVSCVDQPDDVCECSARPTGRHQRVLELKDAIIDRAASCVAEFCDLAVWAVQSERLTTTPRSRAPVNFPLRDYAPIGITQSPVRPIRETRTDCAPIGQQDHEYVYRAEITGVATPAVVLAPRNSRIIRFH